MLPANYIAGAHSFYTETTLPVQWAKHLLLSICFPTATSNSQPDPHTHIYTYAQKGKEIE